VKDLKMESFSERPDPELIVAMIDLKDEIFSATDGIADNDPARFLETESLSRNPDAVESEPAKALNKDDFSVRVEAGPTKALMLTKRPLMLELAKLKEPVKALKSEACLERFEIEPSEVDSPTMRPRKMDPESVRETLKVLRYPYFWTDEAADPEAPVIVFAIPFDTEPASDSDPLKVLTNELCSAKFDAEPNELVKDRTNPLN
jgi:hypothetical protein